MLGFIEAAVRSKGQTLRVAMAVAEHVTAHAVQHGIVVRDGAIQIDPKDLPFVALPIARGNVCSGRQLLRADRLAVIGEEVRAVIASTRIQLAVRSDHDAARAVIGAVRDIRHEIDGLAELLRRGVVRVAANLRAPFFGGARVRVVRVHHVDVVAAAQELRVEGETEQAVLRQRLVHLVDVDRDLAATVGWIDAHDSLADAFGDPQEAVGTPGDFPRIFEAARNDARRERFRRVRPHGSRTHIRAGSDLRDGERSQRQRRGSAGDAASEERSNHYAHRCILSLVRTCVPDTGTRSWRAGTTAAPRCRQSSRGATSGAARTPRRPVPPRTRAAPRCCSGSCRA